MLPDLLADALGSPWALLVLAGMVIGDAFFVLVPGEIAVTVLGAAAITTGAPPLWAVIAIAAAAAAIGDGCCYLIGRSVGTERWRWMRTRRVAAAFDWARSRLDSGTAVVLFTARFIPFARLAVNIVAGATRISPVRYGGLVIVAATGWAVYQTSVGALVAAVLPGGPIVTIPVSVVIAVGMGALIDLVIRRRSRRRVQHG